jgi:tRNA pseudouridine55 synthase
MNRYSAKKKDGVPLYRLAREGVKILRDPVPVYVHAIDCLDFNSPNFTIKVSQTQKEKLKKKIN